MSSVIPFSAGAQLPAYLRNKTFNPAINKDVARGVSYPTLSIKGKVFAIVKDSERRVLTRLDDPDETLQSINLSVLRANTKSRVYYAKGYVEGESDGARPTCTSVDGVAPSADSEVPQAKKCQACKHAVWGSKLNDDGTPGKGTECSVNTRLAVADPDKLDVPLLLRVPAGSRKNFADAVKAAETRGIPYNALVMKVSFDKEAPSPKLVFKLTGLLSDEGYAKATELYDSDTVKEIIGVVPQVEEEAAPVAAGPVDTDDLDAAIAAKAAVAKAATKPAVKPTPAAKPVVKPTPAISEDDLDAAMAGLPAAEPEPVKAAPKPTPKPTPAVKPAAPPPAAPASDMDNLLGDLDSLLGATDD